ncbi:MAG: FliM/FliN family flagellar motor switch protein [Sphingobium sp.]|jgi:flagellar motor switch protein FliN/FliY|nr:FliM/FliN family flagellar motor switch protein [Sphingobium sp.]MCI1270377.1 FliM/FliN family flagellar motor switch protein [Sphingobium sp.]MCI1755524.1 FliM/FliN family flagellar motor switch protein [Sphingobium sp.]MCI2052098.1 FliM/FliN family flagellar motor switch protein [Sphingobium sp.]
MSAINDVEVELSIVLGATRLPVREILAMSRGAMIPLDCTQDEPSLVVVNGHVVARGQILVEEDRMSLEITDVLKRKR